MDPGSKAGVTREESDEHRAAAASPGDPDIAHDALGTPHYLWSQNRKHPSPSPLRLRFGGSLPFVRLTRVHRTHASPDPPKGRGL